MKHEGISPGEWTVLTVCSRSFVAAVPYKGHPYFRRTRYFDIAGDEDYPTKEADLQLIADAPNLLREHRLLRQALQDALRQGKEWTVRAYKVLDHDTEDR